MGNKRRKASVIVVAVVFAALALFGFAFEILHRFDQTETAPVSAATYAGKNSFTITSTQDFTCDNGVYMVIFSGANGGGTNYGYGAQCIAFYQGSGSTVTMTAGGTGGTSGDCGNGGSSTTVCSNFAMPSGQSVGNAIAAGGGGGGSNISNYCNAANASFSSNTTSQPSATMGKNSQVPDDIELDVAYTPGAPATRNSSYSSAGLTASINVYTQNVTYAEAYCSWVWPWEGPPSDLHCENIQRSWARSSTTKDMTGSGGGAGYKCGSGGKVTGYEVKRGSSCTATTPLRGFACTAYPDATETSSYYYGQGGGGICSLNCYPLTAHDLGNATSTNAKARYYRIDPVVNSSYAINARTDSETVAKIPSLSTSPRVDNTNFTNNYELVWVYQCGGIWYTNANDLTLSTPGTRTVSCYCVLQPKGNTNALGPCYRMQYAGNPTGAAAAGYGVVASTTVDLHVQGVATYNDPTAIQMTYRGSSPLLKVSLLTYRGSATNGIMKYKLGDDGDWTTNPSGFTETEVGSYPIYYYVEGNTNYDGVGSQESPMRVDAQITRADPKIHGHGYCPTADGSKAYYYNGDSQILFRHTSEFELMDNDTIQVGNQLTYHEWTGLGTVEYGWSDNDSTPPTNTASTISELTASDVGTYHLWYKINEGDNFSSKGWERIDTAEIIRSTYTYSLSQDSTFAEYDGKDHVLFDSVSVSSTTCGSASTYLNVYYKLKYSRNNPDATADSDWQSSYSGLKSRLEVGTYELYIKWSPKDEYDGQIVPRGENEPFIATFTIDPKDDNTNLALTESLNRTVTLDSNCRVSPFAEDDIEIDLKVNDKTDNNGITSKNPITNQNPDGYNQLSYFVSKETSAPDASSVDWTDCATADELNSAIENYVLDSAGTWYIYFKIKQHYNIAADADVSFLGATITVNVCPADQVPLSGITMTGASGPNENGTVKYNGKKQSVGSGTLASTTTGFVLRNVKYGVSQDYNVTPDEWADEVTATSLAQKKASGDKPYLLWVKWSDGTNVADCAYRPYQQFEIKQLTQDDIYFGGIVFNSFTNTDDGVYSSTFNNDDQKLIKSQPTIAVYKTNESEVIDLVNDIKSVGLNVGADDTQPSQYYPLSDFASLTVRNVGSYYVWITWGGNDNITGGVCRYRFKNGGSILTPKFKVNQLQDASSVGLMTAIVQEVEKVNGGHPYKYKLNETIFQPEEQALFKLTEAPALKINNQQYNSTSNVSYAYLLTSSNQESDVSANTTDWQSSPALTKQTDVGTYYLWLKIGVNDKAVSVTKYINLGSSSITATTSYVQEKYIPTAKTNIVSNLIDFQQLIEASAQTEPGVEYSLGNYYENAGHEASTTWKWTSDVTSNDLKAKNAGVYKVYYRGAAYDNMFTTQYVDATSSQYITVVVSRTNSNIKTRPSVKSNIYYTGQSISCTSLFTDGEAKAGDKNLSLVYRWKGQSDFYPYGADELKITNAGAYILQYKPKPDESVTDNEPEEAVVYIEKVNIKLSSLQSSRTNSNLTYKAADYSAFLPPVNSLPVNYELYNSKNNSYLTVSSSRISYSAYGANNQYGAMGKIWYAASTSKDTQPISSSWVDDYTKVKIRQVGTYYLWVKVESGTNHYGYEPYCFQNNPIKILPANSSSDVRLTNTSLIPQQGLSYNGHTHNLLSSLQLVVEVKNRDEYGNEALNEDNSAYNILLNDDFQLDYIGTIYYALAGENSTPGTEDWKIDWQLLTKINYGVYRVFVRFSGGDRSNLTASDICLSDLKDGNGQPLYETLKINQLDKNNITPFDVYSRSKMYLADNLGPELVIGNLQIMVTNTRFLITSEFDLSKVKYCLWNLSEHNGENATATDYATMNWQLRANLQAQKVGFYQLYVDLTDAVYSNNIDTSNRLVYALFSAGNYAEITSADERMLTVSAPTLVDNLTYNGTAQKLIQSASYFVMKNGKTMDGSKGRAFYYISGSQSKLTHEGTTFTGNGDGWYTDFDSANTQLTQSNAGTYYIWVKFEAGTSHAELAPRCVGLVTIKQASDVTLSGINLASGLTYNGNLRSLVTGAVDLEFDNGYQLRQNIDYHEVYYAYSNNPNEAPAMWMTESQMDPDVWKSQSELSDLQARDAGDYYIWIKVIGTNNVADFYTCYLSEYVTISPRALTIRDFNQNIQTRTGLSYVAEYQVLADVTLNAENKLPIKINGTGKDLNVAEYNPNVVVTYGLGTGADNDDKPTIWMESFDSLALQGRNAGTYYLWVSIEGSDNFYPYVEFYSAIVIDKASIELVDELGYYNNANQLTYSCFDQTLLTGVLPRFKFQPIKTNRPETANYYGNKIYYANEITSYLRYSIGNTTLGITDYHNVKGLNAGSYEVYYGVLENDNWYASNENYVLVTIAPRDAGLDLEEAPSAIEGLEYNEQTQNLITMGSLRKLSNGRGAALEGCKIVFWHENRPDDRYYYSYSPDEDEYVWEGNPIMGRSQAGTYRIYYQVLGSNNENYKNSTVYSIEIEIGKRRIWWEVTPTVRTNLRYTGQPQNPIVEGQLNAGWRPAGVSIKYTTILPDAENRVWNEHVSVNSIGWIDIYYIVDCDGNNVFVGEENNGSIGTRLSLYVGHYSLCINTAPQPSVLTYNAEEQILISYASLSTESVSYLFNEEDLPCFQYKLKNQNGWRDGVTAIERGEYIVEYKVFYSDSIFEFVGDIPEEGEVTVTIQALEFNMDELRAVYDENSHTVTVDAGDRYSEAIQAEIRRNATFKYRLRDDYNQEAWLDWTDNEKLDCLGTYQFKVFVKDTAHDDEYKNFTDYEQQGIYQPYGQTVVAEDRSVYISMPEDAYSNVAYVRAWIDFTGTMLYDDSPFKAEGWANTNSSIFCIFRDVNSCGRGRKAVLRVQTVNSAYYYRSTAKLDQNSRKNPVNWSNEEYNYLEAYKGLQEIKMRVWLYEVYHIQYDGSGTTLAPNRTVPAESWKWHGVDFLLTENVFQRQADGEDLIPNGWNTSRAGNGTNYPNGSYYRENVSRYFYPNFFNKGDVFYKIDWIITDGMTTYCLARDTGNWVNADDARVASRATGIFVARGEQIVLPQIIETEDGPLWSGFLFGNYYIKGWNIAKNGWDINDGLTGDWKESEYYLNMTALRDYIFVADLVRQTEQGVQCIFYDAKGNTISNSGIVANGAKGYMAMSGVDAAMINDYRESYDAWVDIHGNEELKRTATGIISYDREPWGKSEKTEEHEEPTNTKNEGWNDYFTMFFILGSGVITTFASLAVYLTMRRKIYPLKKNLIR